MLKYELRPNCEEAAILAKQIKALADAMWQLLDDMGTDGTSVCLAAKAQARIAFEPFNDHEAEPPMPLADAWRIFARTDY